MFAKFGSYHMFFFLPKKVYATLKFKQTKTSQNRNNQDIFLEIEFFKKIKWKWKRTRRSCNGVYVLSASIFDDEIVSGNKMIDSLIGR